MARPQSIRAHDQVLEAALKLFSERGIDSTSMDSIAEASGVSKATIYKHWSDKDALCLEVLARLHETDEQPTSDAGDVRSGIVSVLSHCPSKEKSEIQRRMMPHLMAYAARNRAFGLAWRTRAMEPPRKQLAQLLKRGIEEGQLAADLDLDLSLALLIGPMMYCGILSQTKANSLAGMPDRVVEAFWKAHAIKPKLRGPRHSQRKS
jgi:AcrR family transcriptional regulator